MAKPITFKYEDFNVYNAEDVMNYDPIYFKGCSNRVRNILIKFKEMKENVDYIWLYQKTDMSWNKSVATYKKAKLILINNWVEKNVPKFKKILDINDYKYPPAPEILELNDNEKFKDENCDILDIEVRGERNPKNCYFRVKDISAGFEIKNLQNTLTNADRGYQEDKHYKRFSINTKNINDVSDENKTNYEIFLTYKGILKVLFSSRSGNAEKFTDWAVDTLFTVQMGTIDAKEELASTILGVDINTVKRVLSSSSSNLVPCLYLLYIGKAKDILKDKKIDYNEEDFICKFGYTTDLKERLGTHFRNFKDEYGAKIELLTFSIIDPDGKNLSEAEKQLHNYFIDTNTIIKLGKYNEIIKITKKQLDRIKQQYKFIQNLYKGKESGHEKLIEELNKIIEQKENELKLKEKDLKLKDKDIEIIKNDCTSKLELITYKYENKLKDKDIEIIKLKNILLQNNIKI